MPTAGVSSQLTPVLLLPVTVAVNCCDCETLKVADVGLSWIVTGVRLIVAVADFVGSTMLVALIVTDWVLVTVDGAVYRPVLDSVPTAGLRDQVTLVFVVPVTVAVNCCVCETERLADAGVT